MDTSIENHTPHTEQAADLPQEPGKAIYQLKVAARVADTNYCEYLVDRGILPANAIRGIPNEASQRSRL